DSERAGWSDGPDGRRGGRIAMNGDRAVFLDKDGTLVEVRRRLGRATPRLRMVVVAMRQNLHEFADLVRLAHRLSVEAVFLRHLCHDFGGSSLPAHYRPMREFIEAETLLHDDPDRIQRHFDAARAVARDLGVDLRLPRTRPRAHPPGTPGPDRC